jgi:DNA-binding NarL/FixJ family response regulator
MSDSTSVPSNGDRGYRLLLIDRDSIFRLGLRVALNAFPDIQIVAEAATTEEAAQFLQSSSLAIDLVVLDPQNLSPSGEATGWEFCQQLKSAYPQLAILVLSTLVSGTLLLNSSAGIVNGYCPKGTDISLIITAIRETATGKSYWEQVVPLLPVSWRERWRQSGLEQIETTLAQVKTKLENRQLSLVDWLFWTGRQRELKTARWLVERLLPGDSFMQVELPGNIRRSPGVSGKVPLPQLSAETTSLLLPNSTTAVFEPIFEATRVKLSLGTENQTSIPLEIDILKPHKKHLLLEIILSNLQELVRELQKYQLTLEQLKDKNLDILQDLWKVSLTDFFGKYYTLSIEGVNYELVDILLASSPIVRQSILQKIPLFETLLGYLVAQKSLEIGGIQYEFGSPTAWEKAEILLQNLIIQVGNSVIQPLLNNLGDREEIKTIFYAEKLLSSREIARFRNDLSWKYRREKYLDEPIAIFESRYWLFVLKNGSIQTISIYAPRREELEKLQGVRLTVTLLLELRDAIAPRLRAFVSFASGVTVYLLTQVVGKAIGLIGKGILQGIGTSLQEARWQRKSDR